MYLVVIFTDTKETAIVPGNWIDPEGHKCCLWPPYKNSTKLSRAVKDKIHPEANWSSYPYRELYRNGDYDKVRRKLTQSEYTSELGTTEGETDNETSTRRERNVHPPARYAGSSDGSGSTNLGSQSDLSGGSSRSSPIDNILGCENGLADVTYSPGFRSNAPVVHNNLLRARQSYTVPSGRPATAWASRQDIGPVDLDSERFPAPPPSPLFSRGPADLPSGRPATAWASRQDIGPVDSVLHQILESQKRQERLNSKLDKQHDLIFEVMEKQRLEILALKRIVSQQIRLNTATEPELEPLPEGIDFPLESVATIEALEGHLADPAIFNTVLHKLRVVGGATVKEASVNLMRFIFAKGPAEQYCWRGSTEGRKSFSSLRLKEVLFRAVRKNPSTKEATNTEIKKVVQEWFRTAVDRNGGRKRRQPCVVPPPPSP